MHDILVSPNYEVQNIALFDLDGVLNQNPPESFAMGTVSDPDYWHKHWSNTTSWHPQPEIVDLHDSLIENGWATIILTARNEQYWPETFLFLRDNVTGTQYLPTTPHNQMLKAGNVHLLMYPRDLGIGSVSHNWKRSKVMDMQARGINPKFLVEDYKPNVEAVRDLLPCLLYERQK